MSTWDDKPNDYEHALAEVERLRAKVSSLTTLLDQQMGTPCEQIRHQQELEEQRAAAIEECALIADKNISEKGQWVATTIRALKEK